MLLEVRFKGKRIKEDLLKKSIVLFTQNKAYCGRYCHHLIFKTC